MELTLVRPPKKQGICKSYSTGTIALYKDGMIERLTTYNSAFHRKEIIERWMRETRNLSNVYYQINPEL